jgi:transcriptional regulator with XRE-family HTH domain
VTARHTLGWRIGQKRREKGVREGRDVTQADLAAAVGASATSVSEWEADKKAPRDPTLELVARFLNTTAAYLRYGVQPREEPSPDLLHSLIDPASDRRLTMAEIERAQAKARLEAEADQAAERAATSARRKRGGRKA